MTEQPSPAAAERPGTCVDAASLIAEMDFSGFRMRVDAGRYTDRDWAEAERERLWMRCWQVAGRETDIPEAGDWMVHRLYDQSWIVVRGRDRVVRGFVNSCRHRGNALCNADKGRDARFTCPYHNWTYGLDGDLLAVARPDFDGTLEDFVGDKAELGLRQVPVDCFGGFVFLNPDPVAAPLADFLGEIGSLLATFPGVEAMLPRFEELLDGFRDGQGVLAFPAGVTGRALLQQATREVLEGKGLDVSGLTDNQLSDNQFYLIFPNLFITIRAGEATVILSTPHPDGDPNRCHWHVMGLQ